MIKIENINFQYANSEDVSLKNLSLTIPDGQCVLICGESGCGKTTVTRLINGLIPHYYEGDIQGNVTVNGLNVTKSELYETAGLVGSVFQNPRSQFFCVDTTSEIAFGCENAGLPENEILKRIDMAAEEIHIKELLDRNIFKLSGGEKQKVACASVSAQRPDIFVLDEPTSNLDADSIEQLKQILMLWKSQGKTILVSEHRLYWLKDICDRVIYMKNGKIESDMSIEKFRELSDKQIQNMGLRTLSPQNLKAHENTFVSDNELTLSDFTFSYSKKTALNMELQNMPVGGIIAVIGHNGAGKSTFSKCFCGLEKQFKGKVLCGNVKYGRKDMLRKSYMVMQDVNHQLFCETVEEEVMLGADEKNCGDMKQILESLDLLQYSQRHPMSLSGGQKQRVAVASALLADKEFLIFDEPTSGLDYKNMEQTAALISSLKGRKTVFIVTHDPEFIVRCCTHILRLENGKVSEFYPLNKENSDRLMPFFMMKSQKDE